MERNTSIGESRTDLHDNSPIAWPHSSKRRHGSPDVTEIGYVCHAPEFFGCHRDHRRVNRHHRIVYPNVHRPEPLFDRSRGSFNGLGNGHVARASQRFTAKSFDFLPGSVQSCLSPCQQSDSGAAPGKCASRGAANPSRRPGNDHHLILCMLACRIHSTIVRASLPERLFETDPEFVLFWPRVMCVPSNLITAKPVPASGARCK